MNILYGGTFNPPTIAHYEIAKYLISSFPDVKLTLLPTANHYKKSDIIDFHHRFNMLSIMAKLLGNNTEVSDFEAKLDKYYGTYYTLNHYKNHYFVMGADNLISIEKWINYPNIVIENKFIVFPRDDINLNEVFSKNEILQQYKDNFIILNNFLKLNLSSSEYRKTKNEKLILPEINEYIINNNLYKEEP